MSNANAYSSLPESAFWKTAVATRDPSEICGLWNPKFLIRPQHKVVTFGSCFAQHIGRALRARGYSWLISEKPPEGLSEDSQKRFNYDLFSCRTGNIYTASLLKQWVEWAFGRKRVPNEYWVADGRYYDPFRPAIEPNGFESLAEMRASRQFTLAALRRTITEAKYFVFTLGLTESWFNKTRGYEYPMCPGTVAGTFDPGQHEFRNQSFEDVRTNLLEALAKIRSVNKDIRVILTVSPVPLTATNSGRHVLTATMESKSILRAVAGQVRSGNAWIDYFPSYEIITSPVFGGKFFEANMRSVAKPGVDFVMDSFFADMAAKFGAAGTPLQRLNPLNLVRRQARANAHAEDKADDVVCEEHLLEAFGERP